MDFVLNAFFQVDNLTKSILIFVGLLFLLGVIAQVKHYFSSLGKLKQYQEISDSLDEEDVIRVQSLTTIQQDWGKQHLILTSENDWLVAKKHNGRFLTLGSIASSMIPLPTPHGRNLPALLTSIGVAGTFLGITVGLSEFNFNGVDQGTASLLQSASQLLDGMKTAFYTSLAGLAGSAIIMIIMQSLNSDLRRRVESINLSLQKNLAQSSGLEYLKQIAEREQDHQLLEAQRKSSDVMVEVGNQISQLLGGLQGIGNSLDGEKMAEQIASAIDKTMQNSVAPVLTEFKQELETLRKIKEDNQQELLTNLVNTIKQELIQPVTEELHKTTEAVNAINSVSEKLNTNVENVLMNMAQTVETIDRFNQVTMSKLQEFAQSLRTVLEGFKDDTKGTMQDITQRVHDVLKLSEDGMASQRIAFEASANKASEAFKGMGDQLGQALENRAKTEKALFEATEQRIENLLHQTSKSFEEQNSVLRATGEEASALMQNAKQELQEGLGDIDTKVTNMSQTVQRELESFRVQYQQNLTQFFNDQNNLLEDTLGKQANNLVDVVNRFKDVFEEEYNTRHTLLQDLAEQHSHLQKSAATIEKLVKAIGLTEASSFSELQDIAHTMGRHIGELKRDYEQASKVFREISEGMPAAMEDYFKQANQSTEVFFKEFDEAASKIHNRLSQAADFLVDARLTEMDQKTAEAV